MDSSRSSIVSPGPHLSSSSSRADTPDTDAILMRWETRFHIDKELKESTEAEIKILDRDIEVLRKKHAADAEKKRKLDEEITMLENELKSTDNGITTCSGELRFISNILSGASSNLFSVTSNFFVQNSLAHPPQAPGPGASQPLSAACLLPIKDTGLQLSDFAQRLRELGDQASENTLLRKRRRELLQNRVLDADFAGLHRSSLRALEAAEESVAEELRVATTGLQAAQKVGAANNAKKTAVVETLNAEEDKQTWLRRRLDEDPGRLEQELKTNVERRIMAEETKSKLEVELRTMQASMVGYDEAKEGQRRREEEEATLAARKKSLEEGKEGMSRAVELAKTRAENAALQANEERGRKATVDEMIRENEVAKETDEEEKRELHALKQRESTLHAAAALGVTPEAKVTLDRLNTMIDALTALIEAEKLSGSAGDAATKESLAAKISAIDNSMRGELAAFDEADPDRVRLQVPALDREWASARIEVLTESVREADVGESGSVNLEHKLGETEVLNARLAGLVAMLKEVQAVIVEDEDVGKGGGEEGGGEGEDEDGRHSASASASASAGTFERSEDDAKKTGARRRSERVGAEKGGGGGGSGGLAAGGGIVPEARKKRGGSS